MENVTKNIRIFDLTENMVFPTTTASQISFCFGPATPFLADLSDLILLWPSHIPQGVKPKPRELEMGFSG